MNRRLLLCPMEHAISSMRALAQDSQAGVVHAKACFQEAGRPKARAQPPVLKSLNGLSLLRLPTSLRLLLSHACTLSRFLCEQIRWHSNGLVQISRSDPGARIASKREGRGFGVVRLTESSIESDRALTLRAELAPVCLTMYVRYSSPET